MPTTLLSRDTTHSASAHYGPIQMKIKNVRRQPCGRQHVGKQTHGQHQVRTRTPNHSITNQGLDEVAQRERHFDMWHNELT